MLVDRRGRLGLYIQAGENERDAAADALAVATSQYRQAMGADPVSGPIPEPANASLARDTREEYVGRFAAVAREHAGTSSGALAWLEAGSLEVELERLEAAAESFGRARDEARGTAVAALAEIRLATLAEQRGDAANAAARYEAASAIEAYPLRANALADAARCWAQAGEPAKAIEAFNRLETRFPEAPVPPPVGALIAELRSRP